LDAQQTIARGRGRPLNATQRSRELCAQSSAAEQKLWRYLRRKAIHGHRFRHQLSLGPYFADFCCLAARLVVEVDGNQHAEPAQALHDIRRTAWLNRNRFHVIRFAASDGMTSIDGVLEEIERVVSERKQFLRLEPQHLKHQRVSNHPLPLREAARRTREAREAWGRGRS
jgi:very-short-patch-repair endonuclease